MFKIIFNRNSSDKQIDTQIDNLNCCYTSKLEAILNDDELMAIIENMQSIYVCNNFVKLYNEFKNSSKDTINELLIIGKCDQMFNTKWTGDFFNKLKLL